MNLNSVKKAEKFAGIPLLFLAYIEINIKHIHSKCSLHDQ